MSPREEHAAACADLINQIEEAKGLLVAALEKVSIGLVVAAVGDGPELHPASTIYAWAVQLHDEVNGEIRMLDNMQELTAQYLASW